MIPRALIALALVAFSLLAGLALAQAPTGPCASVTLAMGDAPSPQPGVPFEFGATLSNAGPFDARASFIAIPVDVGSEGWIVSPTEGAVVIPAGGSAPLAFQITPPTEYAFGTLGLSLDVTTVECLFQGQPVSAATGFPETDAGGSVEFSLPEARLAFLKLVPLPYLAGAAGVVLALALLATVLLLRRPTRN